MASSILHIVNGDSLHTHLTALSIDGDFAIWREMLCMGPTCPDLLSPSFATHRESFLKENYEIAPDYYRNQFLSQLAIIQNFKQFNEIVCWFEYDLFCHINLMACLSFLKQLKCTIPIKLVCSGRINGENDLKGLSELKDKELVAHYGNAVQLTEDDIDLADYVWKVFCSDSPIKLKPNLAKDSSFKYLSNCLSAHKQRFPNAFTGLNVLETNILRLITMHKISSRNQLCGYALSYQGYYGYGDQQIIKMIDRISGFFEESPEGYVLTEKGNDLLDGKYNAFQEMKKEVYFGGAQKYDFVLEPDTKRLLKL